MLTLVGDAFARPILDHLKTHTYDLSGVFVIGSGGAILSPHFKQALLEHVPHAMVVDGFGASETGAQGSHATKAGDTAETGKFAMTTTVVLKNDLSGRLEPGSDETGWLAKPGRVPLGYYKDAAKTAKTFPVIDGTRYAVPGDHAQIRADGTLIVLGRGSVCINSGGEKIYPEGGRAGAAQARGRRRRRRRRHASERFGEQVTAVVQPRAGAAVDRHAVELRRAAPRATSCRARSSSSTRWCGARRASRTTAGRRPTRPARACSSGTGRVRESRSSGRRARAGVRRG
jgi:acyl-CoA synthetase (AMP-forming)/AMP-acid ligase II